MFQILRQKPTKYPSDLTHILFKYKPLLVSANQIAPSGFIHQKKVKFTATTLLQPQFLQYLILWASVEIYKNLHINITLANFHVYILLVNFLCLRSDDG